MKDTRLYNFEISTYCNAKCPTCFRTHTPQKLRHLNIDLFQKFLLKEFENIKTLNKISIAKFCGELGDPLLHPKIENIIFLASKIFDEVRIYTNGGCRKNTWFYKIMTKYKNLFFVFGIDGTSNEYNRQYRINVNTDLAISNMLSSSEIDSSRTYWEYTVFNFNYQDVQNALGIAKKNNISIKFRFNGRDYCKLDEYLTDELSKKFNEENIEYYICQ